MNKRFTVVDLFCGAGGLSLGCQRAGFSLVQAFDNWKPAVETYRANFGHHVEQVDVTEDVKLQRADLVIGGPPCQGFSSAGMRRPRDERNTLAKVFGRLIARFKPPSFIFENVEGFLTGVAGQFVFDLLDPLIEAGYRIHLRKINAANYGVPQHRKRVIAIGGLGWDPPFPSPTHSAYGAPGAHLAGRNLPATPSVDSALHGLPPATPVDQSSSDNDHVYTPLRGQDMERATALRPGQTMRDLPEELWHCSYRRRANRRVMDGTPTERRGGAPAGLRRLCADAPSKAITGGALNEFVHPDEHRPLTVRECARLQTFPDSFRFVASRRDAIQLIGNAVPPLLAEQIAKSLIEILGHARPTDAGGALLSFVPTMSNGGSPILRTVTGKVFSQYCPTDKLGQMRLQWH